MENSTLGVGIIGGGPVTQAIHLPTLARLTEVFHVAQIMDIDPDVAQSVAARVGAAWTTDIDDLLGNEDVQIVVICSPDHLHAEQVIAACRAGKQAVLCEKPFGVSQAEAQNIASVSKETQVPIIVGAMHTFDPGWIAAKSHWGDLAATAHTLRYSVVLPPNARFEDFATEVITRPAGALPDMSDPDAAASYVRAGLMGLAVHDLPLVRAFCPDFADVEVLSCSVPRPAGYLANLRVGDRRVQVFAVGTESWEPEWYFEAIGDDVSLRIDFTPSYVQAGSATARIRRGTETEVLGPYGYNGYEAEWRFVADLARGKAKPLDVTELIHDLTFALEIADKAADAVRAETLRDLSEQEKKDVPA